jgi:hypothetical protein
VACVLCALCAVLWPLGSTQAAAVSCASLSCGFFRVGWPCEPCSFIEMLL